MDINFFEFGLPAWWLLPIALLGIGLAFILYGKKGVPWSRNQNIILGSIRFFAILLLLSLLLNPFIRKVVNEIERPLVVIGIDNTSSIASAHDDDARVGFLNSLNQIQDDLQTNNDYRVEIISLQGEKDSLSFDDQTTDFSAFFGLVEDRYGNQNLENVVIATDGIFNRGASPAFRTYNYPLYTLGLGDTIPQRDVILAEVRNNAVAYSGNEFPVRVEVTGEGFEGQPIEVKITEKGRVLDFENEVINQNGNEFTFFLTSEDPGLKHYTVSVSEFAGEATLVNNRREIFIEVLESKKQVLIASNSPHPDIRAIRSALEETGNYEVTVFMERVNDLPEGKKFDVQILMDGVDPFPNLQAGTWTINSNFLGADLKAIPFLNIVAKGQPDAVSPSYNSDFSKFKLTRELDRLDDYPPISVPFGDYNLSSPYEVLLYQRVGSVVTQNPLIVVFDDGDERQAVTVGQGIWQWRLQEGANHNNAQLFTEIVQKLVQYLSINENKKQFRVNNGAEIFTDGEVIYFNVEIYDDIFQTLEGQPYQLEIQSEDESVSRFDFVYGSENKVARTTSFLSGTYSYVARTEVGDNRLVERGEFVVNALQLEQLELTDNHDLLRQIAGKSGGKYFHYSDVRVLGDELGRTQYQGVIHSDIDRTPLISSFWIMLLIAGLLSAEWGLRKFWGGY